MHTPNLQLNVALNKPTNQSGGVVTGIGGSNNAVNGYYDSVSDHRHVSSFIRI